MNNNLYIKNKYIYDEGQRINIHYIKDLNNGYFIGNRRYLYDEDGKILEEADLIQESGDFILVVKNNRGILKNNKLEVIGTFPDKIIVSCIDLGNKKVYAVFGKYHVIFSDENMYIYDIYQKQLKLKLKEKYYLSHSHNLLNLCTVNGDHTILINQNLKVKIIKYEFSDKIVIRRYLMMLSDDMELIVYDFYDDLNLCYYIDLKETNSKISKNVSSNEDGVMFRKEKIVFNYLNDNLKFKLKINLPSLEQLF